MYVQVMSAEKPWHFWCTQKTITNPPDFSGLDPETGEPWLPSKVIAHLGMSAFDSSKLEATCQDVLSKHPDEVDSYRKGKTKVLGKLIKAVLDATNSGADARVAKETLERLLQQ